MNKYLKVVILLFLIFLLFLLYFDEKLNLVELFEDQKLQNKKIFITFGATGSEDYNKNTNYSEAVNRITNQAEKLNLFDQYFGYSDKDLKNDNDFWIKHSNFILSNARGYGYWIWKPYLIMKKLEEMNDNDILVYADSGCEIMNSKKPAMEKLFEQVKTDLLIGSYAQVEYKYTKKDLIVHLNMDNPEYINTLQHAATTICILKCPKTIQFVKEWYELCCNYSLLNDSPSVNKNHDEFIEHRHDQSIFSLLTKKNTYNFKNMSIIDAINIIWNRTGISQLENKSYKNVELNLGNHFSEYFYKLALCILRKKNWDNNPGQYDIIQNLTHKILYQNDEIYGNLIKEVDDNFIKYNITLQYLESIAESRALWFILDNNNILFWTSMKPLVKKILNDMFTKSHLNIPVDCPVIHFRCADTPFIKQRQYHLVKYEYYKKALELINLKSGKNYNKVILLSCHTHEAPILNQEKCMDYNNSLKSYLNSIGYEVDKQCDSNINDFAKLFYAPAVVSNVSSYSFMTGFFGKGIFVSSEFNEENNTEKACTICDGWMIKNYQIKHKLINDYYDTNDVINNYLTK